MTVALSYFYLGLSIVFEVIGTSALKESNSSTRLLPSLITIGSYIASFLLFSLTLRTIPVGIPYAVWAGLGIVLIAAAGWVWFKQPLDGPALIGLALIVGGVVTVNALISVLNLT